MNSSLHDPMKLPVESQIDSDSIVPRLNSEDDTQVSTNFTRVEHSDLFAVSEAQKIYIRSLKLNLTKEHAQKLKEILEKRAEELEEIKSLYWEKEKKYQQLIEDLNFETNRKNHYLNSLLSFGTPTEDTDVLNFEMYKNGIHSIEISNTLIKYAQVFQNENNLDMALNYFNKALEIRKQFKDETYNILIRMGYIHEELGQIEKSLQIYKQISSPIALERMADIYENLNFYQNAFECYEQLKDFKPVFRKLGILSYKLCNYKKAREYLHMASKNEEDGFFMISLYTELCNLALGTIPTQSKIDYLEKSVLESKIEASEIAEFSIGLGTIYMEMGNVSKAYLKFKKFGDTKDLNSLLCLAKLSYKTNRFQESHAYYTDYIKYMNDSRKFDTDLIEAYETLGKIYRQTQKYEEALGAYSELLQLKKDYMDNEEAYIDNMRNIGLLYEQLNDRENALHIYESLMLIIEKYYKKSSSEYNFVKEKIAKLKKRFLKRFRSD